MDSVFSPSWYRVANLKPRLREHVQIHRHDYRDQVWFILQDHAASRSHRFTPAAERFIGLLDGRRSVQVVWDATNDQLGDAAPTQDEAIRLLGQLHAADALICDVTPDTRELFRRYQRHERQKWKKRLWTPLAIRFPLIDPERFLAWSLPAVRPLFTWAGLVLWLVVVTTGGVLAAMHWSDLTENIVDRAMTPQNLLLLWLIYPVVKALHELGHGYATKRWGGEVHEMGIMLLVFMPVPYVDTSAAWGFRDKRKRMLVGAVGIMTELFLGALAMMVWVEAEPGAVRTIAYNVMLISGVSTLFFNGNPLLRFDGYYVLADALEIPNLATRSNKYYGYLIQRWLYGVRDSESPARAKGEKFWFLVYGFSAFVYRMVIVFVIILYIAGKFFALGVLLAIWATTTQLLIPLGKNIVFLVSSPKLKQRRGRAIAVTAGVVGVIAAALFVVPVPLRTETQGVIWLAEQSQVRAATDGFVTGFLAGAGSAVRAGEPLIRTEDPFLQARVQVLAAQLGELQARYQAEQVRNLVEAAVIREEIAAVEADLQRAREKAADLVIRSPKAGLFIAPGHRDLAGSFLRQGQVVSYVMQAEDLTVRVIIQQRDIDLVRQRTRKIEVMPGDWEGEPFPATILREVPAGSMRLPTPALGSLGGGPIPVDPSDGRGLTTLERVFQFELVIPPEAVPGHVGGRVHVQFDHGTEPLGLQLYRSLRQLFLKRFSV